MSGEHSELVAAVGKTAARSSLLACSVHGHPLEAEIDARMKNDVGTRPLYYWLKDRAAADPAIAAVGEHTMRKHRLVCLGLAPLESAAAAQHTAHDDAPDDDDAPTDRALRDALKRDLLARHATLTPKEIETYVSAITALGPKAKAGPGKKPPGPPENIKGARARVALAGVRDRLAAVGEDD